MITLRTSLVLSAALMAPALIATPASASFKSCAASLKSQMVSAGISRKTVNKAFSGVKYDEKVVRFSRAQPEYKTPIWDYLAFLVDDERVATGRKMMKKHSKTLKAAERTYGFDRYVIAAVWGVESDFGNEQGSFFIPHALTNLICAGRRAKFWRGELVSSLKIADSGDLKLEDLYGSWAGAFGQTQFIPSTYRRLAVDFDRDGRKDLVRSVPDAVGLDRQLPETRGLAKGRALGFRGQDPEELQRRDRTQEQGVACHLEEARRETHRRQAPVRRSPGRIAAARRQVGTGLPGHP